jgi:hypothetical protein
LWSFFDTIPRKFGYFKATLFGREPGIGRWWRKSELEDLAHRSGFECVFLTQNPVLHTAHYRYDVLLRRSSAPHPVGADASFLRRAEGAPPERRSLNAKLQR